MKGAKEKTTMTKLVKKLNDEIIKFQDKLNMERKIREETENAMFRMLEDINAKFQSEIQNEKTSRLTSEEQMVRLLEETCNRIEHNFKS